jgi:flagellar P-ring protein precursor FlgI
MRKTNGNKRTWIAWAAVMLLLTVGVPEAALAVKISDVARFQGEFPNKLMGMGLVVGLPGTGDGGDFLPAMRPLSTLLARLANPVGFADELEDANNVAIVLVEATLPPNGVREGDRVDVQVSSVGAAKSVAEGRLVMTPLLAASALAVQMEATQVPPVYAFASGPVVTGDTKGPRTGVIRQGATIEASVLCNYIVRGRDLDQVVQAREAGAPASRGLLAWVNKNALYVTLVLDGQHASWAMANVIAQMINDDASNPDQEAQATALSDKIAVAADRNNVIVRVPDAAAHNPAPFLARIETLDLLMPPSEARVIVNRSKGSVIITGDVEISPVVITFKGMTITTMTPRPKATPEAPLVEQEQFAALDPSRQGGPRLRDLVAALNDLKIPPSDRVHIVEQLHRMGKLHAKLIVEE